LPPIPFSYRPTALEEGLFAEAAAGQFDEFPLFDAALIASGVDDAKTLRRYDDQWAARVDELRRSQKVHGTPLAKAQAVFEFLHRRVLTGGYRLESTDLRDALDRGRFNCVSASVLFRCLAAEFGLAACGLEVPGHVMVRLRLADGPFDVETTCARWFHLVGEEAPRDAKMGGPRRRREVSDIELTAMIYYNRGIDLLAEKRFPQAAAANAKALRLAPSNAVARGNFLATLNNWAIDLGSSDHETEAAALLRQGMAIDPHYETFTVNYVHLHRQKVERLCALGRYSEAVGLLAQAAAEQPGIEYFRQAQAEVYRRWGRAVEGRRRAGSGP
jgi:tetratricopeptide (TPR) repeat protein